MALDPMAVNRRTVSGRERVRLPIRDDSGQMTVELAVVMPVALVVVLIVVNVFYFLESASAFDQLVPKAVVLATMETPATEQVDGGAGDDRSSSITAEIERGLGHSERTSVSTAQTAVSSTAGFLGRRITYRSELRYTPWPAPRAFRIAGASTGTLSVLVRSISFTVDSGSPEMIF